MVTVERQASTEQIEAACAVSPAFTNSAAKTAAQFGPRIPGQWFHPSVKDKSILQIQHSLNAHLLAFVST